MFVEPCAIVCGSFAKEDSTRIRVASVSEDTAATAGLLEIRGFAGLG